MMLRGHTALVLACDQDHLAVPRVLLAYGAKFDTLDNQFSLSS